MNKQWLILMQIKKIMVKHEKDLEWSYKKAIKRTTNPKFNDKIKKIVGNLLKDKTLITMQEHLKKISTIQKNISNIEIEPIKNTIIEKEKDMLKIQEIKTVVMNDILEKNRRKKNRIMDDLDSEELEDSSMDSSEDEYMNSSDDD